MNIQELLEKANDRYKLENFEEALELYNQVLLEDTQNYVAMIRTNELKDKVAQSKTDTIQLSAEMQILNQTLLRLAERSKENKMYEKSINLYKQILESDPENKEAIEGLSQVRELQSKE